MPTWVLNDEETANPRSFFNFHTGAWDIPVALALADEALARQVVGTDDLMSRQFQAVRSQGKPIAQALREAFRIRLRMT